MNKAASKLAAGVRKVKAKQESNEAIAAPTPKQQADVVQQPSRPAPSATHPDRVWPD